MELRPKFEDIKTYSEFEKYYWYREELQDICKQYGLEYNANKTELNKIIKAYFEGVRILHKPRVHIKSSYDQLTLNTSLINCGFVFSNQFREFYSQITGEKNFKFTADMVATVKAVKQNKDENFTLGDLLDIKTGKKEYAKFDKSACQWNQFLKDFCADKENDLYKNKLEAASQFWALLRKSNLPKVYTRKFIQEHKNLVKVK